MNYKSQKKRPGLIVKTKTGLVGRTFNNEEKVNGKVKVYTENQQYLCDPATLTIIGYID